MSIYFAKIKHRKYTDRIFWWVRAREQYGTAWRRRRFEPNPPFWITWRYVMLSYFTSLVMLVLRYTLHGFLYLDFTKVQFFFWMFIERFVFINHFKNSFIYGYVGVELWNTLKYQMKGIYVRTNDSFYFFITGTNIITIQKWQHSYFTKNIML